MTLSHGSYFWLNFCISSFFFQLQEEDRQKLFEAKLQQIEVCFMLWHHCLLSSDSHELRYWSYKLYWHKMNKAIHNVIHTCLSFWFWYIYPGLGLCILFSFFAELALSDLMDWFIYVIHSQKCWLLEPCALISCICSTSFLFQLCKLIASFRPN